MKKLTYRIRNWKEYNKALIQRGSLTLWFSEDSVQKWHSCPCTGTKGHPQIYSDDAILCALLVRSVYHLPLRALVGFLLSIVTLLTLSITIPSYTQICRRAKALKKNLAKLSNRRPTDLVFDSTGLKVYGEGEWKVRQHGKSKRRTWRKLHIAMDPKTQEIILSELTLNSVGDAEIGADLLKKAPNSVKAVYGDGAYDKLSFREEIENKGAVPIIPPPKNATVHRETEGALKKRDDAVLEILGFGGDEEGRKIWKKLKGYHTRSLVETTMYRFKQILDGTLRSREYERQCTEAYIKCLVLNKMTQLGMPKGSWKAAF